MNSLRETLSHFGQYCHPLWETLVDIVICNYPSLLTVGTLAVVIWYLVQDRQSLQRQRRAERLTEKEVEELVEEFEPAPLLTPSKKFRENDLDTHVPVVTSLPAAEILVDGKAVTNLATTNFLGLVENAALQEEAAKAVKKYGVGSCGPRGFYGTIDVHLDLEKRLSEFLGTEQTCVFSSAYATMSSIIPTFASRGDLVIADERASHATKMGLLLSRSDVFYFKHNDMGDLRRILDSVRAEDQRTQRPLTRRFIVVEGLYRNTGQIVPLPDLLQLKEQYCYRVILDDSCALGVLGAAGRGTCEHYRVPIDSVDMVAGDLGNSLASVGGFLAGPYAIVSHLRLNASGYVFSASSPPFLMRAATVALELLEQKPELVKRLEKNVRFMREALKGVSNRLDIGGDPLSPLIHLRLREPSARRVDDEARLQRMVDRALAQGVALTRAAYSSEEPRVPPPSIRLVVSAAHEEKRLKEAAAVLRRVASEVLA
jgi:serine palmitoyltransferase